MLGDEPLASRLVAARPSMIGELPADCRGLLNAAAWRGNLEAVRAMLAVGFDVAWGNEHRATALHAAAWKGHVQLVQLLLQHDAPLDVKETEFDCTPLEWRCTDLTTAGPESPWKPRPHGTNPMPRSSRHSWLPVRHALSTAWSASAVVVSERCWRQLGSWSMTTIDKRNNESLGQVLRASNTMNQPPRTQSSPREFTADFAFLGALGDIGGSIC